MGFCMVADVEQFLQLDIPAEKEASCQRAIEGATAAIQNYCQQELELVSDDEYTVDGKVGTRIYLPELPVVSVASVVEDGDALTVTTDYKLGANGVLHRVDAYWAAGIQNIVITYTHGYAAIPDDIRTVCYRAASRAYQAGLKAAENEGVPGVTAKSLGDYSVSFGSEQGGGAGGESLLGASAAPMLLRSEKDMLSRYRMRAT